MDILFSPYGVGAMPKTAIAEIERRTEDLLKDSSFQRMIELEQKYKQTDRLRSPLAILPSSELPVQSSNGPPPRPQRPVDSIPPEQFLMVKATRRAAVPPSLSLAIPPAASNERRSRVNNWEPEEDDDEDDDDGLGTPTNTEPFQKQVKFVAPEDSEDEDAMSEQSSICQSPSWEGYGQRRKDKKLEAERRKKEKEQAEREARAAKKRNTVRLSKAPPAPAATIQDARALTLTPADRSMSDPQLVNRRMVQSVQFQRRPEDGGRTTSADNLQHTRWHQPAVAEVMTGPSPGVWYGDGRLDPSSIPRHLLGENGFSPRQELRRSMSDGPVLPNQHQPVPGTHFRPETQSPSPSRASRVQRTPRATAGVHHLSQQEASSNSQESPSGQSSRNGYVLHQRALAAQRAMAGLADEQIFAASANRHYPPSSSSSSGQSQNGRRSSLTQDAVSAAMKLVGIKTPTGRESIDQGNPEYLAFKAVPYSASTDAPAPSRTMPAFPMPAVVAPRQHEQPLERPSTSHSSSSSNGPSTAGPESSKHSKKNRGSKDSVKSAGNGANGGETYAENSKSSVPLPPYFRLRALMQSRATAKAESKASAAAAAAAAAARATPVPLSVCPKPNENNPQDGSRVSEGSSSSSGFGDGSSHVSPSTTPSTSRPQSAKDVPVTVNGASKESPVNPQHQDLAASRSETPRAGYEGQSRSAEMGTEDKWSRTALPLELDFDTDSFMASVTNFEQLDGTEQGKEETLHPEPLRSVHPPTSHPRSSEPGFSIPPRSRKRSQSSHNGPPVINFSLGGHQRHIATASVDRGNMGTPKDSQWSAPNGHPSPPKDEFEANTTDGRETQSQHKQVKPREPDLQPESNFLGDDYQTQTSPVNFQQDWTPGTTPSTGSAAPSAGPGSPDGFAPEFQAPGNPYFADFSESFRPNDTPTPAAPPSPISLPSPLHQIPKPPPQTRANSAPMPSAATSAPSRSSTPAARANTTTPVSILKQPRSSSTAAAPSSSASSSAASERPPVLSAIPKHMQIQAGRGPAAATNPVAPAGAGMAPIAKMFVQCCNCKFYHDMPSKLYECMAKPDAVVEDKLLGISGAITTMVKCPWCHHNMSRGCCAGYAAVVYLKEKLH
ncbi:uncharacterized protein C8A04DRAFT_15091 [Dichotomopilus funicola]|uniref:Uncharacterized protein n=1 Tax=Dichotomopilus funicola TaxID=1934379 RepID=A0AAN6UWA5_9PEZI|nr:hypothetical protein C8A04DRAFT_15091 [Dichotomopilus funicola]